jgi:hypothetical protein
MKTRRLLVSVLPLALLASPALHSDVQPPKIEITFGYLAQDTTCPKAQHALAAYCPYLDGIVLPQFYIDFTGNKNVDRWVGHNVRLRGTMEFTDCSLPLLHVTNIGESTGPLPPCPGLCQPGDPPPCP